MSLTRDSALNDPLQIIADLKCKLTEAEGDRDKLERDLPDALEHRHHRRAGGHQLLTG